MRGCDTLGSPFFTLLTTRIKTTVTVWRSVWASGVFCRAAGEGAESLRAAVVEFYKL
jgi:hypothetical protein